MINHLPIFKKKLKNLIWSAALMATSLGFYNASAADPWQNPDIQVALNPYSQSTLHIENGNAPLETYGSGDVNLDGVVNWEDAQNIRAGLPGNSDHMNGVNDMADVNWDGAVNEADAQIIDNGGPTNWNHLDATGKIDRLEKWIALEPWNTNPNGTLRYCGEFVDQQQVTSTGITNPQNWNPVANGDYSVKHNALAGIPIYNVGTTIKSDVTGQEIPHEVCGVLVGSVDAGIYGEDVKDITHWYFWDPMGSAEDNGRIHPENLHLRDKAHIGQRMETQDYDALELIHFSFPNNDGNVSYAFGWGIEERMSPTNPNEVPVDSVAPEISAQNVEKPFVYGKSIESYVNENPASVTDNMDPSPVVNYNWTDNQTSSGSSTDVNYDISIDVDATDNAGNSSDASYVVSVRDRVPATADFDNETPVYGEEGDNPAELARENVYNVADNSRLPVDTNFVSTLTSEDAYTANYNVNVELEDISGNKTNLGDLEVILAKQVEPDVTPPIIPAHDVEVPFIYGKSSESHVNENSFDATDNRDPNPIESYSWTDNQTSTGSFTDVNYDIAVRETAVDNSGNSNSEDYVISVRDKENPTGEINNSPVYGMRGDNPVELARGNIYNVADDSQLPVDTNFVSTLASEDAYTANYNVNVELEDISGNKTNLGDLEVILEKPTSTTENPRDDSAFDLKTPYPNPISDVATIPYNSNATGAVNFDLYNTAGQLIDQFSKEPAYGNNSFEHNFSDYSDGVYMLRMTDSEGWGATVKITKN